MNLIPKLFKRSKNSSYQLKDIALSTDMHSHLLPGIDDGAQDLEESLDLIRQLAGLGYQKLITTPHIMGDFYQNTPAIIEECLATVRQAVEEEGIPVTIEAGAEYYLDEWFPEKLARHEIQSFGDHFLLFETAFMTQPHQLFTSIFDMKVKGYQPVLAHPERYLYLQTDYEQVRKIYEQGVFFQLNLNSLTGYYGSSAEDLAAYLIKEGMVDFAGTDTHGQRHINGLYKVLKSKDFGRLGNLDLKNNCL
jgi:tyrosine-protein phosphatase YwqE